MKRITLPLFSFVFVLSMTFTYQGLSQTKNAFIKAAEQAALENDYYAELVYYTNVLEFDEEDTEFLFKTAEAARKTHAYKRASELYTKLLELDTDNTYPAARYQLARMQQRMGSYTDAQANYKLYLTEVDNIPVDDERIAQMEMSAADWAQEFVDNPWEEITIEHLSGNINTPYSEFAPTPVGDSLFYSSHRYELEKDTYDPNRLQGAILMSEDFGVSQRLDENTENVSTHAANTTFNADGSRMYFTLCETTRPDTIRCDMYYRDLGDAGWGDPVAMTDINVPGYTTTQPNVGYESETGKVYLYFASNRPGGEGNLDIYRVELTNQGTGEIENLRSINTTDNEVTPFYHGLTKTLYFSSSGRKSLGGLDIYKTSMRSGEPGVVQHLGAPINTSYHDLYYVLNEEGDVGYLSSNRVESFYLDEAFEACCYDIYKVDIAPFANLIAQSFDFDTRDSLKGSEFRLLNLTTGEETVFSQADLAQGIFPLNRDMEYQLITSKQGYIPDTTLFNTVDIVDLEDIVKRIYLKTDVLTLDAFTFDDRTKEALTGATVTLYDLDDENAEPVIIENFNANDFHFELERGKRYRLTASRKGYKSETIVIDTNDYWDKSRIKRDIYLKIGDLEDFLPLVLYFDNDQPNPDTWLTESDLQYKETYPPYYARKQTFIDIYTEPLNGAERTEKANQLASFFDNEVKKGNDDLAIFLEVLEAHLKKGDKVNISLKGYTSPRSSRGYNLNLGKRRVSSVHNSFMKYDNERLKPYLTNEQLTIGEKSYGETTAKRDVSSSRTNERLSIYSYEASKERRVEIIQVELNSQNRKITR